MLGLSVRFRSCHLILALSLSFIFPLYSMGSGFGKYGLDTFGVQQVSDALCDPDLARNFLFCKEFRDYVHPLGDNESLPISVLSSGVSVNMNFKLLPDPSGGYELNSEGCFEVGAYFCPHQTGFHSSALQFNYNGRNYSVPNAFKGFSMEREAVEPRVYDYHMVARYKMDVFTNGKRKSGFSDLSSSKTRVAVAESNKLVGRCLNY